MLHVLVFFSFWASRLKAKGSGEVYAEPKLEPKVTPLATSCHALSSTVRISFFYWVPRLKAKGSGEMYAEPKLEPKKHRRESRKRAKQAMADELEDLDEELAELELSSSDFK